MMQVYCSLSFPQLFRGTLLTGCGMSQILFGDHEALRGHWEGLLQMIRIGGGLHNLGLDGLLQETAHRYGCCTLKIPADIADAYYCRRVDHMVAFFRGATPRFSVNATAPAATPPTIFTCPFTRSPKLSLAETGFKSTVESSHLTAEMVVVLEDMISLSFTLDSYHGISISAQEFKSFTHRRAGMEERLQLLHTRPVSRIDVSSIGDMQECCRLAALIYTYNVFRVMPPASAVHKRLTDQLRLALTHTALASLWEEHIETLIWITIMAGAVATDAAVRHWYVSLICRICGQLRIESWRDCQQILRKFVCSERAWESLCKILWVEVVVNL